MKALYRFKQGKRMVERVLFDVAGNSGFYGG